MADKKDKKNKNKERDEKENGLTKLDLHPETKNGILIVVFLVMVILSILSYFGKAGIFGEYFLKIFNYLFGWGYFLIPIALIFGVISLFKSIHQDIYLSTLLGAGFFLVGFLGILEIIGKSFGGQDIQFGGLAGYYIALPFLRFLGVYASVIVLFALLAISAILAFNLSLDKIWQFIKSIFIRQKKEGEQGRIKVTTPNQISSMNLGEAPLLETLNRSIQGKNAVGVIQDATEKEKIEEVKRIEKNEEIKFPKIAPVDYKIPPSDLLECDKGSPLSGDIRANANIIKRTLQNFNIEVEMAEVNVGPTVTQYTLRPAQGVKLSKINALQNDLSLALAAHPIRLETPIPGRSLVGLEIPNKAVTKVRLRNLIDKPEFSQGKTFLTLALGRDVAGNVIYAGLEKMPHMLIAGATGAGKTICLNAIIMSLLCRHSPNMLRLLLVDPKRVEFPIYNDLPHLLSPVIVDTDKTINVLRWLVGEMDRRFNVLANANTRDIGAYNGKYPDEPLPYIVIVIDELADLMASHGRDVEAAIVRLSQMARAVGIHLIVATQRPSVEVLTGLIKANITSRVAFQVASQVDSRTILDMSGAEKLLGNGDMLFLSGDSSKPRRVQGVYVSDKEIKKAVDFIKEQKGPEYDDRLANELNRQTTVGGNYNDEADDDLYGEAKKVVVLAQKASASLLQRRLRVGYARAARLLDLLEDKGVIGPGDGAKAREVYGSSENIMPDESGGVDEWGNRY